MVSLPRKMLLLASTFNTDFSLKGKVPLTCIFPLEVMSWLVRKNCCMNLLLQCPTIFVTVTLSILFSAVFFPPLSLFVLFPSE